MITRLKDIVLKLQFVQDYINWRISVEKKSWSIEAFKAAHKDILDTQVTDIEARAQEIAEQKLAELLSIVDAAQIMSVDAKTGKVFIGGVLAGNEQLANLRSEAIGLREFAIWKLLHNTPKKLAENALFKDDGDSKITHTKGRAILYMLATQEKIVDTLSTLQ